MSDKPIYGKSKTVTVFIIYQSLFLPENRYGFGYSLFVSEHTVLVNLGLALFSVCKASRTADTTADTSHTFDEVSVKEVLALFKQSYTAGFNTVAGAGVELEVFKALFLKTFGNRIGKTAGASEDSSVVGSVVEHVLFKCGNVEVAAVKECLKLFKCKNNVNIRLYGIKLNLSLFSSAGTDEDNLRVFFGFLDVF